MDKYERVLDIIEHPENYSSEQLQEILSDEETRDIYNALCKAESALKTDKEIDVDAAWQDFSQRAAFHPRRHRWLWFSSRAASIAVVVCTSIVAIAAGIAVTMTVSERKTEQKTEASIGEARGATASKMREVQADTAKVDKTPILFEDEALEVIMKTVADHYGVEVRFSNKSAGSLHLYYKLNPALPLDDVVSQLNTFKQINITRKGNTLNVE